MSASCCGGEPGSGFPIVPCALPDRRVLWRGWAVVVVVIVVVVAGWTPDQITMMLDALALAVALVLGGSGVKDALNGQR